MKHMKHSMYGSGFRYFILFYVFMLHTKVGRINANKIQKLLISQLQSPCLPSSPYFDKYLVSNKKIGEIRC